MQAIRSVLVQPAAYSQQRAFRHHGKRARYIAVRVFEPEELDGPGVGALLERDRKNLEVSADALAAFADGPAAPASSSSKTGAATTQQQQQEGVDAGQQQRGPAGQRADKLKGDSSAPKRAREAIDQGLQKFQAKDYRAAIDLFQLALELPGSGLMRMSGSVREYSCASEGEENSALYNMACAWAALGEKQSALTVLEALLDNDFDDFNGIRTDPDLASLRGPELDSLLAKKDGLFAKLFAKKKESTSNKPWIQW
ncbi:hypothetical protein D9Q98_002071 [Chlorella vulgaris]|uniref:Uncharacterized protein n=1 Tax=Chlorella vulgaris TaxID=3077 RepID=A0A9D4TVL2_CHLVU|nr:hypothetical protein D9Q98_002071 [Chlorella vulgaris]